MHGFHQSTFTGQHYVSIQHPGTTRLRLSMFTNPMRLLQPLLGMDRPLTFLINPDCLIGVICENIDKLYI